MAGLANDREKRLAELRNQVTRRNFNRHASVMRDISELPVELQCPAVKSLADRETLQTIIVFPPQLQRGWEYVPKQALLFSTAGATHLLASIWPGQEPEILSLKGSRLMYMRVKLLLLYGSLEIVAQGQGSPTRISMEFNTLAWNQLSLPLLQLLRSSVARAGTLAGKGVCPPTVQPSLQNLPLKFSNGVRIHGLLPGEHLEELVFQPAIWKRRLYFFRQPIIANTLLLLTSNYMVLIQEELNVEYG